MTYEPTPIRVSDADRERAAVLLREHWMAGRLDSVEFDERCAEVYGARTDFELGRAMRELPMVMPAPAPDSSAATTALILGIVGLVLFAVSFGFLSTLTLPVSATAWGIGRSARRRGVPGPAKTGMVLGMIGTALSLVALGGCALYVV
jgi:hypothetical protein